MPPEQSGHDEDELLRPALAGVERELPKPGRRPWRLNSLLYVGFFGGAIAATVIAWLNAERLGIARQGRLLIAAVGALALVAAVAVVAVADPGGASRIRTVLHITGITTAALQRPLQSAADRRHTFGHGDEGYDSLWVPGLAAVIGLGTLETILLVLVDP